MPSRDPCPALESTLPPTNSVSPPTYLEYIPPVCTPVFTHRYHYRAGAKKKMGSESSVTCGSKCTRALEDLHWRWIAISSLGTTTINEPLDTLSSTIRGVITSSFLTRPSCRFEGTHIIPATTTSLSLLIHTACTVRSTEFSILLRPTGALIPQSTTFHLVFPVFFTN